MKNDHTAAGDTLVEPGPRLTVTLRGYVALILSLVVAAGLWAQLLQAGSLYLLDGPTVPFPSFISPYDVILVVSPVAIVVTIVVDIVAGARGGPNRIAGVIGGALLFSAVVGVVIVTLVTQF